MILFLYTLLIITVKAAFVKNIADVCQQNFDAVENYWDHYPNNSKATVDVILSSEETLGIKKQSIGESDDGEGKVLLMYDQNEMGSFILSNQTEVLPKNLTYNITDDTKYFYPDVPNPWNRSEKVHQYSSMVYQDYKLQGFYVKENMSTYWVGDDQDKEFDFLAVNKTTPIWNNKDFTGVIGLKPYNSVKSANFSFMC